MLKMSLRRVRKIEWFFYQLALYCLWLITNSQLRPQPRYHYKTSVWTRYYKEIFLHKFKLCFELGPWLCGKLRRSEFESSLCLQFFVKLLLKTAKQITRGRGCPFLKRPDERVFVNYLLSNHLKNKRRWWSYEKSRGNNRQHAIRYFIGNWSKVHI